MLTSWIKHPWNATQKEIHQRISGWRPISGGQSFRAQHHRNHCLNQLHASNKPPIHLNGIPYHRHRHKGARRPNEVTVASNSTHVLSACTAKQSRSIARSQSRQWSTPRFWGGNRNCHRHGVGISPCDRTTSEMRGPSPGSRSGDSRWSQNRANTHMKQIKPWLHWKSSYYTLV
jgi:hypothetical protein